MGLEANLGKATTALLTDPHHLLCSEIATVNTLGGRYTQWNIVYVGFSDHMVLLPSGNALNLAANFGFSDLDPSDGGWSQNPM